MKFLFRRDLLRETFNLWIRIVVCKLKEVSMFDWIQLWKESHCFKAHTGFAILESPFNPSRPVSP